MFTVSHIVWILWPRGNAEWDNLANLKEMINFVRKFPNRIAIFESLKATQDSRFIQLVALQSFWPTSWFWKINSLKNFLQNYEELILFFERIELEKSDAGAKAKCLLNLLRSFDFIFVISLLTEILEPVEILKAFL